MAVLLDMNILARRNFEDVRLQRAQKFAGDIFAVDAVGHVFLFAGIHQVGANREPDILADRHLPEPDARPIAEEREAVLGAAWGRLRPRCQELLSLLMTDDPLGYKDLSALLQMPVGSIGPTRQRCLEHLRRLVEEEGMTSL